jgi:superfamily II DNA or RNA helicase
LDVPAISAVILLRPTASLGLHLQQIGRGLRPAPGKTHLTVLDHVGNCLEHGRADDARKWTLDAGLIRERKSKEAAVRRCQDCGAANATTATKCEACGAEFPAPEARDFTPAPGSLIELSRERITFLAQQPHHRLRGMVLTEPEVRAIAREKGYKRGWAMHYMREQAERHAAAS